MILGIDVSKWQGEMNWPKAREAEAKFAFIRAGSINKDTGICYEDYQLKRNAELAPEQMDDRIGFYWYFRPKHSPIKQADYFYNLIRNYEPSALVVDCEAAGAPYATIRKNTEIMASEVAQMIELDTATIYTRASYWNSTMGYQSWAYMYYLWIARYNSYITHPWGDGYCKPLGWDDWVFWQYSADGNGMGPKYGGNCTSMDLNHFNGDMRELNQYFGVDDAPTYPIDLTLEEKNAILSIAEKLE